MAVETARAAPGREVVVVMDRAAPGREVVETRGWAVAAMAMAVAAAVLMAATAAAMGRRRRKSPRRPHTSPSKYPQSLAPSHDPPVG